MARGIAIRSITTLPNSQVEIAYSEGSPIAPAGQSGTFVFGSLQNAQDEIKALEQTLTTYQLTLMHLAFTWLQSNGGFGNVGSVTNKELRFDPSAANPIRIV